MVREPVSDVPRYRYRVDTRLYEINELFLPQQFVPKGSRDLASRKLYSRIPLLSLVLSPNHLSTLHVHRIHRDIIRKGGRERESVIYHRTIVGANRGSG